MDKNRVAGSAKEVEGEAEGVIGKATGDAKLQADGKTDRAKERRRAGCNKMNGCFEAPLEGIKICPGGE